MKKISKKSTAVRQQIPKREQKNIEPQKGPILQSGKLAWHQMGDLPDVKTPSLVANSSTPVAEPFADAFPGAKLFSLKDRARIAVGLRHGNLCPKFRSELRT